MALILKKRKSGFQVWYEKNKEQFSKKRNKRYADDPEYRQRALEASRRHRRGERSLPIPPDAPISFAEAAERTDISISTLREWKRQKFFPEPKHHNGRLWFTDKQVMLLKKLKDFFDAYRNRRPAKLKDDWLKGVVASIAADWD